MMNSTQIIKDLKNGNSYCQLCSMQFKTKTLTAHINGRKHREAATTMKNSSKNLPLKRKTFIDDDAMLALSIDENRKKARKEELDADEQNSFGKSPWQKQNREEQETSIAENVKQSGKTKIIEELPKGFFDDERMNNRVRETIEKHVEINSELDKFYKEVEELETQKEEVQNEVLEFSAIRNDIEVIDEQIERWKAVNDLEIQKESIMEAATSKFEQNPNFAPIEEVDDDVDYDFDNIDWRIKTL